MNDERRRLFRRSVGCAAAVVVVVFVQCARMYVGVGCSIVTFKNHTKLNVRARISSTFDELPGHDYDAVVVDC